MWFGAQNINEMIKADGWKVEFFCNVKSSENLAFKTVKIGEVLSERKESLDPQTMEVEEVSYIGLENIHSMTGDLVNFSSQPSENIKSRSKVFYRDDVLYGRLRPSLNKVYLVDSDISLGICSNEFLVLIPNKHLVDPMYLRFILASDYVHKFAVNYQTGSALPRLSSSKLLNIEIPLPSLEEQRKIGEHLKKKNDYRKKILKEALEMPDKMMKELSTVLEKGNIEQLEAA